MSGMYAAMVLRKLESLTVKSALLGVEVPLKNDIPGLLGVILVFDNEEQATEQGNGHVLEIAPKDKTS